MTGNDHKYIVDQKLFPFLKTFKESFINLVHFNIFSLFILKLVKGN
jgi:hypothetical protein